MSDQAAVRDDRASLEADGAFELGSYLKHVRRALGLTLRAVEVDTDRAVSNGYLSQIESGSVQQPSPRVLHHLAQVYAIDYGNLLRLAGHHIPSAANPGDAETLNLNGFPLRSLEDLTPEETKALLAYVDFIKSRR